MTDKQFIGLIMFLASIAIMFDGWIRFIAIIIWILSMIAYAIVEVFRNYNTSKKEDSFFDGKAEVKDNIQKSREDIHKINGTKAEFKENLEYAEKEIKKLKAERDQLRKDYVFLAGKLRELEEKLRKADLRQSTAPQDDSSKEADKWRKAYETSRDEFRIAAQGRQEALEQVEKLKAQLAEKDRLIAQLRRK